MPKFLPKVKVINIKVKVIILCYIMDWKGSFWIWKGHFCIVCKKWGPWSNFTLSSYLGATVLNLHLILF